MISIQGSVSKGWLHKEYGFSFGEKYYFDPLFRWNQDQKIEKVLNERFFDYALYNMESNLVQAKHYNANQMLVGAIQPNLILGAALGAEFIFPPDNDSDINSKPCEQISKIEQLPKPESILETSIIKQLDKQIITVKNSSDLQVIPPFFWDSSGRATIHGFITTSLKLFGEKIFMTIYDNPEFLYNVHSWITDAYIVLLQHFSRLGNLPVSSIHIGECSGTMLNAEQFENFIVPFVSKMGKTLGPVRFHTCGFSDHLLNPISKINNLSIVDTGSDTSITSMREIFGGDMELNYAPPVEILLEGSDSRQVVSWLNKILHENAEGPLKIEYHLESGYSIKNCLILHDELHKKGLIAKGRIHP